MKYEIKKPLQWNTFCLIVSELDKSFPHVVYVSSLFFFKEANLLPQKYMGTSQMCCGRRC